MIKRIVLLLKYFIFWLIYFLTIKTLFIAFNYSNAQQLTFGNISGIFYHGLKLDISTCSYLLVLPALLILPTIFFNLKYLSTILKIYTYAFLILFSFLVVADLELYHYWGFRLDTTPLLYINTPKSMIASVSILVVIKQLLIMFALIITFIWLYNKLFNYDFKKLAIGKWYELPFFLLLWAFLIVPIRGGFGLAPLNTGTAYFSSNEFANHSAINVIWNVSYSLLQTEAMSNPYNYYPDQKAQSIVDSLIKKNTGTIKLISQDRPNIILIVLESYTARAIKALGGLDSITPRFNNLISEGIFFKNYYGSGIRSDKGLVALISGFPAQPIASIIRYPNKTETLPSIAKDLNNDGYSSAFYYGGDIDFASMRSYITNSGYNKIIDMTCFPSSTYNSKWGVHDHIVFNKLLNDLDTTRFPFFYTFFTLSSHEPFDVPMRSIFKGETDDLKFANSLYYTDSCLGNFIDSAKTKRWWSNTLIILVADHGVLRFNITASYDFLRFKIPMLWIGGVIKKDTIITKTASQTDLPITLLSQMNIKPVKNYRYSQNIFDPNFKGYAYCAYNSGFVFATDTSIIAYDTDEKTIKTSIGENADSTVVIGKAYLQMLYDDFLKRK